MKTFIQSKESEKDLNDIFDYIAVHNVHAAEKQIREIYKKFALICEQPEIGRTRNELLPELRSFNVDNYLVFYRERGETVEIARVLHGSRDFTAIFEPSQKASPAQISGDFIKSRKE
jgi:toxin ParE1/3/4